MNRSTGVFAALALLAAAGGAWLLTAGKGVLGSSDSVGGAGDGDAPREVAGPGGDGKAPQPEGEAGKVGALAAGSRHPERKGVGAVKGRVVKVKSEAPVAAAVVAIKGVGFGGEVVAIEAATDANGAFSFPSVAAGLGYEVKVEAKGDPVVRYPDIEVKAGRTADLGAIVVGSRAAIVGRVVDEKGLGVASAEVTVYRGFDNIMEILGNMVDLFGSLGREPTALARTTADAEGRFRLDDLAPGPLSLRGTLPGKRQAVARVRLGPDGPVGGAVTLTLTSGGLVAGVIVDAAGAGVPRATLAILDENGGEDPSNLIFGRVFAVTDDKGAFRAVVEDGSRKLRGIVEAVGFPTTFTPEFAAGVENLKFVLPQPAEVEITLLEAAGSAPIEGAQVMMMVTDKAGSMDPDGTGAISSGVTSAEGVVRLPSAPGHVEMLMATHPKFGSAMAQGQRMGGGANGMGFEGDVPKEVKAGAVTRATLRLKGGVTVRGKVSDKAGAPVAGAEVKPFNFMMGATTASSRTGADGLYRLENVSSTMGQGTMVVVSAPGFVKKIDPVAGSPAGGEIVHDVTLLAGAQVRGTVLDPAGQPVVGAEVSLEGGGGFDMSAMLGGTKTPTAADGTFVLRDVGAGELSGVDASTAATPEMLKLLEENRPRVRITAEGYVSTRTAPLALTPGGETVVPPLRLSKGATATGLVRAPGGGASAGARVEVSMTPEDGGPGGGFNMTELLNHRVVRCDDQGRFTIPTLAKGAVTLTVHGTTGATTRKSFQVAGDDDAPKLEVDLRNAFDLRGRVLGPDGRGLAGATVGSALTIEGLSGDESYAEPKTAVSDASGDFTLKGLPSGSIRISASAAEHRGASVLGTTGGAPVELTLPAKGVKDEKRLAEIQKEIMDVSMKFQSVKDKSEREALQQKLMELMREQRDLQGDGTPAEFTSTPVEEAQPAK